MHGYAKDAYVQRVENVNFDEYDVKNGKDKLTITMFDVLHVYITDELPRLHGKTATQKRCFSHSGTTTATLPI